MQDILEVNGILLSSSPVGEADKRVVLLTKELGRISAFARGARRMNSSLTGVTRTFCAGKFYLNPGRDAYSLSKAEIRDYFEDLVRDVEGTAYGCYFMELAGFFSRENVPEEETLTLLYRSLRALLRKELPRRLTRRVFELRLLKIQGLLPDFSRRADTGEPLTEGYFRFGRMEPVGGEASENGRGQRLGKSTVYALQFISGTEIGKLFSFTVSGEVLSELSAVSEELLAHFVDRDLKSRDLLSVLAPSDETEKT